MADDTQATEKMLAVMWTIMDPAFGMLGRAELHLIGTDEQSLENHIKERLRLYRPEAANVIGIKEVEIGGSSLDYLRTLAGKYIGHSRSQEIFQDYRPWHPQERVMVLSAYKADVIVRLEEFQPLEQLVKTA